MLLSWASWTTRKWAMASRSWGSRNRCRARCWARSTITLGVSSSGLASVKNTRHAGPAGQCSTRSTQPRHHHLPPPVFSPSRHLPSVPSSTCQAADEMLPGTPQETRAAQSSFQSLPAAQVGLQSGRWLRREAEPSLLLQGTHQGPI